LWVAGDIFWQEFERDESLQADVFSLVDYTHATATEFFEDAEVRDGLTEKWLGVDHFRGVLGEVYGQVNEPARFAKQVSTKLGVAPD